MVIEQYTITNKYNFPQPTIDTILPQRFLEQSLCSLKQVQHQPLQLNPQTFSLQLKPESIPIKPDHQETLVAAVDTSTIKIGDTSTGMIVAIRGVTTWKQNGNYKYSRLGPFIFHVTEANKNQLYNTACQSTRAMVANNASQNGKKRHITLRRLFNIGHDRYSGSAPERNSKSRKKK